MDPLMVKFDLNNIHCADEGDGPGSAEPYLWTVFFKIDGDTVTINESGKLQGTATVVSTPGNHGNLGVSEADAGDVIAIPPAVGRFETMLKPMLITGVPGITVGGHAGCIAILMEEDSTPNDAIAKGHDALNKGIRDELNKLIPTFGINKTKPTETDLKNLENELSAAITSAVANNVSLWDAVWGFFSLGNNQDDQIGTAKFFFSHNQLDSSLGKPISFQQHWQNEGDWTLNGSVTATKSVAAIKPVTTTKRVYDAVWRPSNSLEMHGYGRTYAQYQKQYDDLWKQNYRIHLLNTYEENGQRLYDAVWRPGKSAEAQAYARTYAQYQKQYDDLWKQNYRIYLLNTYEENGQRLYDAVWRPGNSAEAQAYARTYAQYQKQYDDLWKQNYRIYLLNTYEENGQRFYDAVWRPGKDPETQFYGLGASDYQSHYDGLWKQNLRIALLNTYEVST